MAWQGIEVVHVVAMDKNNCIGKGNALPWHISTDLKHFKAITQGGVVRPSTACSMATDCSVRVLGADQVKLRAAGAGAVASGSKAPGSRVSNRERASGTWPIGNHKGAERPKRAA